MKTCPYCEYEDDKKSLSCPRCGRALISPQDFEPSTENNITASEEKLNTIYILIIGSLFGFIGGIIPAFHGGIPSILYEVFNISFGFIIHIVGAILFCGIAGIVLGAFGAVLGIKRIQEKEASLLKQILIAAIWGIIFGFIPNIFLAGTAW